MANTKTEYLGKLLLFIDIEKKIITDSTTIPDAIKKGYDTLSKFDLKYINDNPDITLTQLKSITKEHLIYWNESIGLDTETLWVMLKNHNIDYQRKDELNFALAKGRFRRVDQGMCARNEWWLIRDTGPVKERFSNTEIKTIDEIIKQDEENRLAVLTKCLKKYSIAPSQYLKFGECMAYFNNCKLFEQYFSKDEVKQLYTIWRNFK
ncbi:hypothetical protein [Flavobacterium rhizosphaerae]|uniref:Uncharacterized protein n=1 Tax=Flavobacterium rhizosphaerae TaxID=3163298 RepID=A0ABW8YTT9_9FLAO